jgi:hypothetical protein
MTYDEKSRIYTADDGKMFVRKSDGRIFGDHVQLGPRGSIANYEEREFTEEERAAFWESIGMDDPKKPKDRKGHAETEKEDSNAD